MCTPDNRLSDTERWEIQFIPNQQGDPIIARHDFNETEGKCPYCGRNPGWLTCDDDHCRHPDGPLTG